MKTYTVLITETITSTITVEAANIAEAEKLADIAYQKNVSTATPVSDEVECMVTGVQL